MATVDSNSDNLITQLVDRKIGLYSMDSIRYHSLILDWIQC